MTPVMVTDLPDKAGYFGEFGGRFAPEILMQYLLDLEQHYFACRQNNAFQNQLNDLLHKHCARETPLTLATYLSQHAGGATIYLKREDLTATGSHHINAALGQALLAREMGKTVLVTDTATGLQGLALAHAAKLLDMECQVFIGGNDCARQLNCVEQMQAMGAKVSIIDSGKASLLEANEESTRFWLGAMQESFYVFNSVIGPHPYPLMVRDFQSNIGKEVKQQIISATGRPPDHLVACLGSGGNAIGLFHAFLDTDVAMTAIEATGKDNNVCCPRRRGIYQGVKTLLRQNDNGQLLTNSSLAVGLQACLLGPELSYLQSSSRLAVAGVNDQQALAASQLSTELESMSIALESAHAIAWGLQLAGQLDSDKNIVINLSGKGEKDTGQIDEIRNG